MTRTPRPAAAVSWTSALAFRMARHRLDHRAALADLVPLAGQLCGVHAQLASSAELTLQARIGELPQDRLADELWHRRGLVKTWAMRGTLHLLPSDSYGLWQSALSGNADHRKPAWQRSFGVSEAEQDRLTELIGVALQGPPLTREALIDRVADLDGSATLAGKLRQGWGALLKPAAYAGLLCFAENDGRNVRFTRPDRWLVDAPRDVVDPEEAMREIALRYLAAHGPASNADFARWWGMSPAAAGRLFGQLGEQVVPVSVDGLPCWLCATDLPVCAGATPAPVVRLLPAFDQYVVVATKHASRLMPADFVDRVYRRQGWLSAVVLVGGGIEGIWRHERRGRSIRITIDPFATLMPRKTRQAIAEEAERVAAYLGGQLDLVWTAG